ncbi:hypothetical protein GH808_03680 [Acetobacterium fimetarium]|uniref:Uncharacterized protein n=1 Tax=Acetobacterium fimetarium TaxID=52691 RepID=A0ABR6WTI7_9FIRM|nr:hypothetical protein [Acetobacterium fimetarium]MBC3803536.1 hypothetical protein [Acetobacterium fimetarium]
MIKAVTDATDMDMPAGMDDYNVLECTRAIFDASLRCRMPYRIFRRESSRSGC